MKSRGRSTRRQRRAWVRGGQRWTLIAVMAVAAAIAVSACGGSSKSSTGGSGSVGATKTAGVVHLTWWTMWSGATLKVLDKIVAKYNATHPGVKVTEENIPSSATTSTAKLLSTIAAGDPPDVFTEWWPEIGSFAAHNDLDSISQYLPNESAFQKWEYPVAVQAAQYKGQLYAAPISLNSWALYYNKTILAKYGIKSPPTTLAQLDADQAKMWSTSGGQLKQVGFYPNTNENGFQFYTSFFGATNCFKGTQYNLANCPGAKAEMNWIASYDKYPSQQVAALQTSLGQVAGGQTDIWTAGKSGFELTGPWEAVSNIPASNPKLAGHFGVIPFPGTVGAPSTIGQGNFNIIPRGSKHPKQAAQFIAWLSGYDNGQFMAGIDTQAGWVPGGPSVTKAPAYASWLKTNPELKTFLTQMTSKYTAAPTLTPTQSQLFTAEDEATANVLDKSMTPTQALNYIDQQANG